jgi:ribosomal-protein-alanine N-acetyltransferase
LITPIIPLNADSPVHIIEQLFSLQIECFEFPWSASQIKKQLANDNGLNFGIVFEGKLAGFLFYQVLFDCAEILQIAISLDTRKKGLAEQLFIHSLNALKEQNIERVLLEVSVENPQAISLYKRLKFVEDGVRKNYYPSILNKGARVNAYLYSLVITDYD